MRELNMGVLERRKMDSLTEEEEGWRRRLVDGTPDGRIPEGESMLELSNRMHEALNAWLGAAGRKPTAAGKSRYGVGWAGEYDSWLTGVG